MTEIEALTTREAAEVLGMHPGTLANWRSRRIGPPWLKLGKSIRYRRCELEAWCQHQHSMSKEVAHG